MAVDAALAAFQLAGQARQRVLHQPDVAAMLDRAGRSPWRIEAADWPWPPNAWVCRSVQRHRLRGLGGGEVGDGGIRTDIDARAADQGGKLRPGDLAVETPDLAVAPDLIEIGAVGGAAGGDGREPACAQRRDELPPAIDPSSACR